MCETSLPRILNSHAAAWASLVKTASSFCSASLACSREILEALVSPAREIMKDDRREGRCLGGSR